MAAIITTPFRVLNAENFKEDVADTNNGIYLSIGKSDVWSTTTSDLTDTIPFVPNDHIDDINLAWQQLYAMQKVGAADISHVVPRHNYADGQTYVEWDSNDADIYDKAFYVLTSEFKVYKCIKQGSGVTSVQPTHTSTDPVTGGDGYTWKYMYTTTTSDSEKFLTTSFMPVKTVDEAASLASTDVDYPQQQSQINSRNSSTAAGIERIVVTSGGTFASGSSAPTVTITGDGTGATATATMNSGGTAVESITVTAKGTDYTIADIVFSAGDASARAVLTPPAGHGVDPVKELGAFYVGINVQLDGAGGGDLTVGNDFRQIGILKNPYNHGTTTISSAATLRATKYLQLAAGESTSGYAVDQVIVGSSSGAKAYLVEISTSDLRLYYYQNDKTGYTAFTQADTITGTLPTGGSATLDQQNSTSWYGNPEVQRGSGQFIFLENRDPINRSATQIEDIKCIIEF